MKKEEGIILPIIIVVIVTALLGTAGYFAYKQYSAPKEQPEQITCTDTDEGINIYNEGIINQKHGPLGINSDACFTRSVGSTESMIVSFCSEGPNCYIYELFCNSTQDVNFKEFNCPDGCENGACLSEKIDQTAGWKTYTNTQYGFEIKFPLSDILSAENTMEERNFYKDSSYKEIYVNTLSAGCDLYVYPSIDDKFLSIIKDTRTYQLSILENNGKKYYIGYRAGSSAIALSECTSVYSKVISTFKFTK